MENHIEKPRRAVGPKQEQFTYLDSAHRNRKPGATGEREEEGREASDSPNVETISMKKSKDQKALTNDTNEKIQEQMEALGGEKHGKDDDGGNLKWQHC